MDRIEPALVDPVERAHETADGQESFDPWWPSGQRFRACFDGTHEERELDADQQDQSCEA